MRELRYSCELYEFSEAITPYGTIESRPAELDDFNINDFSAGSHFRTGVDENNALQLELEDRLLTIVLDESGSSTWNDNNGDRFQYLQRLLRKLESTYPGKMHVNLIGFGGIPTKTNLFLAKSEIDFLTKTNQDFNEFLQQTFEDSVFDFAGVRIIRRTDRYPTHPADGVIVADAIIEAAKDDHLTEKQTYYYGVWTFNKNLTYGQGQFIKGIPQDRIVPHGVNFAQAFSRVLPGTKRDEFTQIIYNFVEGNGFIIFDSSGHGRHGIVGSEVVEESFWSGDASSSTFEGDDIKKHVGVRFDGTFDIIETSIDDASILPSSSQSITVNLWIFRHNTNTEQWLIGATNRGSTNNIGWVIGVTNDGRLGFSSNELTTALTSVSEFIPEKKWTMLTVIIRNSSVTSFMNGEEQSTVSISPMIHSVDTLFTGAHINDSNSNWSGSDYFGSLNLISIHNIERDQTYINNTYAQESKVFNQSATSYAQNPPDNKQREVIISWDIADNFNFSGGRIKIVRKYNSIPIHLEDGDLILEQDVESGQFFFVDSFDFIHNANYYYRIFTINRLDIECDLTEARVLAIHTQQSNIISTSIKNVSNLTLIEGKQKILLQWSSPTESEWRGTRIYCGIKKFPTVVTNQQGLTTISDGVLLIDTVDEHYAHRIFKTEESGSQTPLTNGTTYYYTVVTYDQFNALSEPVFITGTPSSQISVSFPPDPVKDLKIQIVNPETLSLQWNNPTIKSEQINLFFGDSSLVFVSVRDVLGGTLDDVKDLTIQVCTKFIIRPLRTREVELGHGQNEPTDSDPFMPAAPQLEGSTFGIVFDNNCNNADEEAETVVTYAVIDSGLIKGLLTHTNDRKILSRREKYIMDVRAQYIVKDPDKDQGSTLFQFNTSAVRATFSHPIVISIVNKLNKKIDVNSGGETGFRGDDSPCDCPDNNTNTSTAQTFNGGYTNATKPYVARVELQFKGESLPDGTPISVQLFKHGNSTNPNPLTEKSSRTSIREGTYTTSAILTEEIDNQNQPTGRLISKSIVDIEIHHPILEDFVDLYVTFDYLGLFVDAVHEIRFIETLFINLNINVPNSDGIDVSEQFAAVWTVDPDNPEEKLTIPDDTLVKWELIKLASGKERPFYSTEPLKQPLSGTYSYTLNGIARHVYFGPIGNIESHHSTRSCEDAGQTPCCVGEQYAIKASVIYGSKTSTDAVKFVYQCPDQPTFSNRRFFMNANPQQPFSGGPSEDPHWITWGDGIHMLKFQIARNPAITDMYGADCFRNCVENAVGGQLFQLPLEHIVQISANAEILWNVTFDEDPYTGELIPATFDSISPSVAKNLKIPFIANIPIAGETTDFYIRFNMFVDKSNPAPQDCESGITDDEVLPCQWRGICRDVIDCGVTRGWKWNNVSTITGTTTLISQNKAVTLIGGGNYTTGIPPIYFGFREPLNVKIIDVRINGQRIDELVVDGASYHTFTVEATFAGQPVPDGTPIELQVTGADQHIVILSSGSSGIIYTRQVNDIIVNPQNNEDSVQKRSLSYFSINPLPNTNFSAKIIATCRYDKLGSISRAISSCIEVNNTINTKPPDKIPTETKPIETSASSNENIVFDTVNNNYLTTRAGRQQRIGHFAAGISTGSMDFMFTFGGLTGNGDSSTQSLTPTSEQFNVQDQTWEFIVDMQTPRAYGQTTVFGNEIYTIGGIEKNPLLNQYIVSRKIELFNVNTSVWNTTLSPMPENYGVAFGHAECIGHFIYVTCGVVSIINSSQPGILNDRILRYSIDNDEWSIITPSDTLLYQRLSPFSFFRSSPKSNIDDAMYYIYGGSVPKTSTQIESERNEQISRQTNDLYSTLSTSLYFNTLSPEDQQSFLQERINDITSGIIVPAFVYPSTGFRFHPGSEILIENSLQIDISDTLDTQWKTLPMPRDLGRAVYIGHQDAVYFMGGSNQNKSTTLNRVETIDLDDNNYSRLTPFNRGRAMFGAVGFANEIYLTGGLTSGHATGYVEISVQSLNQSVEALGIESGGLFITLKNDSGEPINDNIRVDVRGRLRLPKLDEVLSTFLAARAADRALGGTGAGDAPGLPSAGSAGATDVGRLIKAQNSIIDPNSDAFQFNAARKLSEDILLFPIIYSSNEFVIKNGVGGVVLLPRSEDPLEDFQKLSTFIQSVIQNTPANTDERFVGDLSKEELAALGDTLNTIQLPPTIISSGLLRKLYTIETKVTILDSVFFGQTVSQFDLDVQSKIDSKIAQLLAPPEAENPPDANNFGFGGSSGNTSKTESGCFVIQHLAQQDIPGHDTGIVQNDTSSPGGVGGFASSGQCLFCQTVVPTKANIRAQLSTTSTDFYNITDWIPQIKRRLSNNNNSLSEAIDKLNIIDHEIPFGSSQLYSAILEAAKITSGDTLKEIKKLIYIASDNSPNLSLVTRQAAIDEVNSIDGNKNTPIVYTVFSTSFPLSLSAQLERSLSGDVEKLVKATGGQSTTLINSSFLDQILNIALGSATGGLGFGIYKRTINFDSALSISSMDTEFVLPSNTQGFVRFRHSIDGFNFSDFSARYSGSQQVDFIDFIAKTIDLEVVLTTGFTEQESEEYDDSPTGMPKLLNIAWQTTKERNDFIFLNHETVPTNAQQVAVAFDGKIPNNSHVEFGVATSTSSNWSDYQTPSRHAVDEFGKIILLDRTRNQSSPVPLETLHNISGNLYSVNYGSWDPQSTVKLFEVDKNGNYIPVLGGFVLYPRDGQVYFDTKQSEDKVFKLEIINKDILRIGIRLRNKSSVEPIVIRGVGYIYTTNDVKPIELSQVAPRATNAHISPQNPNSQDTFFAFYDFVDLNNDPEKDSIISWFKNGRQLLEIQNKQSWSNADLLLTNKLTPNDKIYFKVIPSDGRDLGEPVTSAAVIIQPKQPSLEHLQINPIRDDVTNERHDTSSVFTLQYKFVTDDTGNSAIEDGTIIKWFINGQLFKENTFSELDQDPYISPKTVIPGEISGGILAHVIGNQVQVEITPKTKLIQGDTQKTDVFTVENSIAVTKNLVISPNKPTTQSTLVANWTIDDLDITQFKTQTDQSEISWLKSTNGSNFTEVIELKNNRTVPAFYLRGGDVWKFKVTSFDGLDLGATIESETVRISV